MKFEVEMTRLDACTVQVEAADRDEAFRLSRKLAPGFRVDCASVVADDDASESGPVHQINTTCEACGDAIWIGDEYHAGEDSDLCAACAPTLEDATA
jgi:hypothetical protein